MLSVLPRAGRVERVLYLAFLSLEQAFPAIMNPDTSTLQLERISSRIPGLDTILGGGFFRAGVYIIQGRPGSGKTILANQLCFGHSREGGRSIYVTLLAESHTRMLQHLSALSFFDEGLIPDRLAYMSAFHDLESEGLKGLMSILRREMRASQAEVLVLDGLVAAAESASSTTELKKFVHEMQTSAVFHGCTVFLLTSGHMDRINPEHTMVDGVIELSDRLHGVRSERTLQVHKFRGTNSLRGQHFFEIRDSGLHVFPRIEALFNQPAKLTSTSGRLSTGIETLDEVLGGGGLPAASATVVVGSAGIGKTSLGLHFLSGATPAEPGVFYGFFESPERLRQRAKSLGTDLESLEAKGAVKLIWHSQGEHVLDELGHRLLEEVDAIKARRLVIDGLGSFFEAATYPERLGRYFACLVNELRARDVTVLSTLETRDAVGTFVPTPYGISAIVDNLLFLRYADIDGELKRLISILKVRSSSYDPAVRELSISSKGLAVEGRFSAAAEPVPTAVPVAEATPSQSDRDRPEGRWDPA